MASDVADVVVNVGAAEVTVLIGLVGVGGSGVEVAIADGVIASTNSVGCSIVSEAWAVGIASGGERPQEQAKREMT